MTSFFERFRRKGKPSSADTPTIPANEKSVSEPITVPTKIIDLQVKAVAPPQLVVGCGQSVGQQRDHNEDSLFTLTTTLVSDTRQTLFGLFIVADGMGGHLHGEVASAIAVHTMASQVVRKLYLSLLSLSEQPPDESFQEIMQDGIAEAHHAIQKQAQGGGTTVTAALVVGEQLTIAHVGDSRAYIVHPDRKLEVITRDHSLVKRLEELGQITSEEAAVHPQRNVLYRAIGQGEPQDADIVTSPIPHGGQLLLCSDGLWGVVPQDRLQEIIVGVSNPVLACQKLIDAANSAGGPDNISAILIRFPD